MLGRFLRNLASGVSRVNSLLHKEKCGYKPHLPDWSNAVTNRTYQIGVTRLQTAPTIVRVKTKPYYWSVINTGSIPRVSWMCCFRSTDSERVLNSPIVTRCMVLPSIVATRRATFCSGFCCCNLCSIASA